MNRLLPAIGLAATLNACSADPVLAPDLSLADRFEYVTLRDRDGEPVDELIKWQAPIRVAVTGERDNEEEVAEHLALLGELTGLSTEMNSSAPNMRIDFSLRVEESWCRVDITGRAGSIRSDISIRTDQPDHEIGRCIVQEMTQSLGLVRDLDGRTDTNFTSYGFAVRDLTESDRQLIAILYDPRLHDGMPRDEVLAVLPEIVADVEAAR